MDRFANLSGNPHLTLLLGAGASAPSGLPTWDEFAIRIAVESGLVASRRAAKILLEKQDQTILLEAAKQKSGNEWDALLFRSLLGDLDDGTLSPSSLHFAAAGHYLANPATTTLGTLNYDTLLEDALLNATQSSVRIGLDAGRPMSSEPTVYHLHGALIDGTAYDPIVTFSDYAELVQDEYAWQFTFLTDALSRGPLILAGTSYRDPDIRQWMHEILREDAVPFGALVTIVREGLGLSRDDFGLIKDALVTEWESIGMTAVPMEDLADVARVVRELNYVGKPDYETPSARAKRVWRAHEVRFQELQREYAKLLGKSTRALEGVLGTPAHRATLWLANGEGQIARWATGETAYLSMDVLKLVPTGHDSTWIAGEALAAEEVKLKEHRREGRVQPTWRSVLALPITVGDGVHPDFATAVLTFGLDEKVGKIVEATEHWAPVAEDLISTWRATLSGVAFSNAR